MWVTAGTTSREMAVGLTGSSPYTSQVYQMNRLGRAI